MKGAVGIAWYERSDYSRILEIMDDAEKLPRTYDRWKQIAERGESQLRSAGHIVVRAVIKPDDFVAWCSRHGHEVDAKGRMAFANVEAARHARGQS